MITFSVVYIVTPTNAAVIGSTEKTGPLFISLAITKTLSTSIQILHKIQIIKRYYLNRNSL